MPRILTRYLEDGQVYKCATCNAHLSTPSQIISKRFHGESGRAYLLETAINVISGPPEKRVLMTGLHTVADIYCVQCDVKVGWTYEEAFEESEKYKEGKYILEKMKITNNSEPKGRVA